MLFFNITFLSATFIFSAHSRQTQTVFCLKMWTLNQRFNLTANYDCRPYLLSRTHASHTSAWTSQLGGQVSPGDGSRSAATLHSPSPPAPDPSRHWQYPGDRRWVRNADYNEKSFAFLVDNVQLIFALTAKNYFQLFLSFIKHVLRVFRCSRELKTKWVEIHLPADVKAKKIFYFTI